MVLPVTGGRLEQLFGARVQKLVPDFVDAATAAALRAQLGADEAASGFVRFPYIDRGSYGWREVESAELLPGALRAKLFAAAEEASGRSFSGGGGASRGGTTFAAARALLLLPGDYVLDHHDPLGPPATLGAPAAGDAADAADAASLLELMLDLSPAAVEEADVIYRRAGKPCFQLPSQPGALSIVERDGSVSCHHGYLSKRFTGARVLRLVLRLAL